ncbi:carboxymuconolactone decarboxylase family protein [Thermodesulfobium acidiphilum]
MNLSVIQRCEWCIKSYVKVVLDNRATKEGIMEAAQVAF